MRRRLREPQVIAALAAIVAVTLFALLSVALQRDRFEQFDSAGVQLVERLQSPLADVFFSVITWAGSSILLIPFSIAVAAWLRHRHRVVVAPLVLAPVAAVVIQNVFKPLFDRTRPAGGILAELGPSFPSGHSTAAAAVWITLAWLLGRERLIPAWSIVPALCLVAAVGISRVYLDVHWTSDVLAGWSVGAAIAGACVLLYERARATGAIDD